MSLEADIDAPHESGLFLKYPVILEDAHLTEFIADYFRLLVSGNIERFQIENGAGRHLPWHPAGLWDLQPDCQPARTQAGRIDQGLPVREGDHHRQLEQLCTGARGRIWPQSRVGQRAAIVRRAGTALPPTEKTLANCCSARTLHNFLHRVRALNSVTKLLMGVGTAPIFCTAPGVCARATHVLCGMPPSHSRATAIVEPCWR